MKITDFKKSEAIKPLTEAKRFFEDDSVIDLTSIKIVADPDRLDVYDIASALTPLFVKMAYIDLKHEQAKHEKNISDDDEKFELTYDALADKVEELMNHLAERFSDLGPRDLLKAVHDSAKDLPEKLED